MSNNQTPKYSESDVCMLLGWLSADISELHSLECPKLMESFDRFKVKIGAVDPTPGATDV